MHRIVSLVGSAALLLVIAASPVAAGHRGATIVETAMAVNADSGEFDYLIAAADRAGLVGTLNGNRQFTVFAPTDAAFEDLFDTLNVDGVEDIDVETLQAVLLYHVSPGQRFSPVVLASPRVRTVSQSFLYPSFDGTNAWINDARIVAADVDASNGVIHVIDKVLLP